MSEIKERFISVEDVDMLVERLPQNHANDAKRQLRKPLLESLDVYDKNVSKGRVIETIEQKLVVDGWYKDICDLKTESFKNIPECVSRYR